ncbi:flagellar biosynthesis anti-sigma factor FlgM [Rhodocyclus tenuis]|uniref:flagellar biosynthesis anti-sigma factor FlgM n=1 Tax=Rhodocyclus tenuis TaxID=1066 RepID=UPI001903FE6B|nr:flagellar biosynthesis anti-sigma factor FlgM [Rhodocyclus tenuis]
MKVERQLPSTGSYATSETRSRASSTAGKPAPGAAPDAGAVRLSGLAAQMSASTEGSPVNSAKIAEIRQAIAEGRFAINAEAIAGRLIDSARELVAAERRG